MIKDKKNTKKSNEIEPNKNDINALKSSISETRPSSDAKNKDFEKIVDATRPSTDA